MALAFLARLLFGLALLAQLAASASAPAASGGARLCVLSHGEARSQTYAGNASEQAPQHETGHRHGHCSFCVFGSGDPPLATTLLSLERLPVAAGARLSFDYSKGLVFAHVDRNASARAPPSAFS
ncbi:DUF2946 family protein [Methylosinus sp. Sm6]|uniref:DUF2946 family protein n=1 Tax=Methylosinus sp. Sm6 TaxID=2866948 RepID=UPI001C996310|nr:DUF2946 family protein [Methylosinus sp. Sm6]MBY6242569.1 hypothetical protein [Methylosinus sp. Sm6]